MPKPTSRRLRALDQLTIAQDALMKALTLLGGKPRGQPRKLPAPRHYVARSYIISCISRLDVTANLLSADSRPTPTIVPLLDDFERDYDKTRRPEC